MNKISIYKSQDVEIIEKKRVFDGFFKIDKYAFRHKLFNGGTSDIIYREIFERGHAVGVLPYDPVSQSILLVEQVRIGAIETTQSPWLLEVIAGMVDDHEDFAHVARKEAEEEAGLTLNELEFMLSYLASPGGTSERLHLYFAKTDLTHAGGIHGLECEGEDIKVHVLPVEFAFQLLEQGEIDNAATVISLQWLQINLPRIKAEFDVKGSDINAS